MSLYVAESGFDYGLKTSGLIDHNSTYTWMAWIDLVSDTNSYGHIWSALGDSSDAWQNADWIGTDSDGTTLRWGAPSVERTRRSQDPPSPLGRRYMSLLFARLQRRFQRTLTDRLPGAP